MIIPGLPGNGLTVTARDADIGPLPQALVAFTKMLPETADIEKSTTMFGVLAPATMLAPEGSIQLYPVAN
jgi:hypothetical protein